MIFQRIDRIEKSLALSTTSTVPDLVNDVYPRAQDCGASSMETPPIAPCQDGNTGIGLNLSCSLGSFPASSMNGTAQENSLHASRSRAALVHDQTKFSSYQQILLASPKAEEHFAFYHKHLDPLIHYVLAEGENFFSMRSRSELLTTAICTVAAYCAGTTDYSEWLELFKRFVTNKTFSKQHAFDDVRALCIGSLWLSDMATALSALGEFDTFPTHPDQFRR